MFNSVKVLFYYPSNKQSNSLETLIEELSLSGIEIILLTTCAKGAFHATLEEQGIKTYVNLINYKGVLYYLKQIYFLIRFCKHNKIDVVCSHLQHVNIISVFAQFFSKSRFIIFRHHFKFNVFSNDKRLKGNRTEAIFDKIINVLAKEIVVPSSGVYNGMINYEGVNKKKLSILPYIYNFEQYPKPNPETVTQIRNKYECNLLLLMCSRLILFKRHYLVFPVIKKLVDKGLDIKLLVLDEGPEKENLQQYILDHNLQNHIFLLGFTTDFINYMGACDLMIHPSLTEASNSAVKEMALLKKAVAVCSQVGDFDDYIKEGANGFLMSPKDTEVFIEDVILKAYYNKALLNELGNNLYKMVMKEFNRSPKILNQYIAFIKRN
jgi:glycosyltransferase involved in cell wall biosynthesis